MKEDGVATNFAYLMDVIVLAYHIAMVHDCMRMPMHGVVQRKETEGQESTCWSFHPEEHGVTQGMIDSRAVVVCAWS